MRSRLVPVVGALGGLLIAAVLVVGVALQIWVLAAVAVGLLLAAILAVQLDTWRRTRSLRNFVRDQIRRQPVDPAAFSPSAPSSVTRDDVVGAVRLMQAQYTGRLDRLQRSLDEALSELASRTDHDAQ